MKYQPSLPEHNDNVTHERLVREFFLILAGLGVVFSGLLEKVQSKNGLAFVLAHELSHLKHRDHLRAMGRSLLLAAMISAFTGSQSDIAQVFIPINQMGMARHSQGCEMQANAGALQILNCSYGHAGGAIEFFEAMKGDARAGSDGYTHYFSSHPQLQARIDNLDRMIKEMGMQRGPVMSFGRLFPDQPSANPLRRACC